MLRPRWRRPYTGGWFRPLVMIFLLLGTAFFVAGIAAVARHISAHPLRETVGLVVVVAFAVIWLALTWRLYSFGLYVGDQGLLYRGFLRRRVVPWGEVERIRLSPLVSKLSGFQFSQATTIWIDRHGGTSIQTWVNSQGVDFLGRPRAFERAFSSLAEEVDRHQRSSASE